MSKRFLSFLALCLLAGNMALAQIQVTGTVMDVETGEPVVGASVIVKGAGGIGSATDINGKFTIQNVPTTAKLLTVSYIGMATKEVAIKPTLKIYLESSDRTLQEQIVVAYGTATKESFTGSATVVGADIIAETQKNNVLDALNGKVAGVQMYNSSGQPGQTTPLIRVRGIGSINAGNAPLIILDGAPFDGDMNTLNPADIESMTVLKDAASNALYGARGANGVIMITTKRAAQSEPAKITIDAKWGSNSKAVPDYETISSPGLYYELYYKALRNQATIRQGMSDLDAHFYALENLIDGSYGLAYNIYNVPEGETLIGMNGKLNPHATMGNVVNGHMLKADDWMDASYRHGLRQEYNVTATQSTERTNLFISLGYLNNEGIVPKTDFERFSGRLKLDTQLKPWLKVGVNVNYAHYNVNSMEEDGITDSSGNILALATQVAPIYPLYVRDEKGNIMVDGNGYVMYDYGKAGETGGVGLTRPFFTSCNALGSTMLEKHGYNGNALNAVGFAEFRFLKDFKFTSTNTVGLDESRDTNLTNGFYGPYASSNGVLTKGHGRTLTTNFQQLLNWHHEFDGGHDVEVMFGHEVYKNRYSSLSATRSNMLSPTNLELDGAVTDGASGSYETDYNTEGWFGRAMYNYNQRYFVSASFRRDASSRFAKENRWGSFWSAGAAWLINKEKFFNYDWVDMLKLKVSYGSQGNDAIGDFRYTNTYNIVNADGKVATTPMDMGNRKITWETNHNFNVGVDFEFFGQRLNGSVEYFYRKTTDMLFSFPLAPSFGFSSYYANVGDMRNQGIEVSLDGDIIRTKDWTWSANVNFTHYKNKVTRLPEERKTLVADGVRGYNSGWHFVGEGISLYSFYTYKYAGVYSENNYAGDEYDPSNAGKPMWWRNVYAEDDEAQTHPIGREKTTDYSEADRYICGNALPDLYGGFGTGLRWKDLDFSINFSFQCGGKVYDNDYSALMDSPTTDTHGNNFHKDILSSWSPENATSNIPALIYGEQYNGAFSDHFLISASYLSLDNINLGWTLPRIWTRKVGIDKVRVYVSADNVALWSKRKGLDPRQSMAGDNATASYYSAIRTISGGIQVAF